MAGVAQTGREERGQNSHGGLLASKDGEDGGREDVARGKEDLKARM